MKTHEYINELKRKVIHLGTLVLPLSYLFWFDLIIMLILSGILTVIAFGIEWLRLTYTPFNRFFSMHLGPMLRPDEYHSITAATWMILSVFLSIFIFQKSVAILTLTYFIAGDGAASLIGRSFGKTFFYCKTVEGSAACLLICLIIGFFIAELPYWIWVSGAFIITVVEALPMKINDNLRVPLIGGSLIEILTWINKIY